MYNFAGIERILACKLNYLAKQTNYEIFLSTYEQCGKSVPFPMSTRIYYEPMNVIFPSRNKLTIVQWLRIYVKQRHDFQFQYRQLLEKISPNVVICTGYSFQVMDIIIHEACHHRINVIVESHTKAETVTFAYKNSYNYLLYKLFGKLDDYIMSSLRNVYCVVTLTKSDVSYWKKYVSRVEIIPNMLTISPIMVKDYSIKRVISAGRYMTEKGFDRLIEAWHLIKFMQKDHGKTEEWELYIYGDGDRTPYQELVNKYGLEDTVHLEPATDNIAERFSECSLYVLSSRYEGFGLVLTEAMSCGLPCISFNCPYGPREIINDGKDGILVDDSNIKGLAKAMERLMEDVSLRKTMGKEAIINVSRYDVDSIMSIWINLFNNI